MSYTLEQFCKDTHDILKGGADDAARAKVAKKLEGLLVDPDFVAKHFDPSKEAGQEVVYRDPLGFNVLVHHNKATKQPGAPHDHGTSWAIYGVARGFTDMTEWRRLDDGKKPGFASIERAKTYRLGIGMAVPYRPRAIHNTFMPEGAWVVRVTGVDLDTIPRQRFVPERNEVKEFGTVPA
jgi:predicted metal-dependent enzyme (double-stranded beta helix superfamily)